MNEELNKFKEEFSEEILELLAKYHTHAELLNPDTLVYKQSNVLELMQKAKQEGVQEIIDYFSETRQLAFDIAHDFMTEIQYDAGAVNSQEEETYPIQWQIVIAQSIETVLFSNPDFEFDEETIEEISTGEEGENEEKYGHLAGYGALQYVLGEYFNEI